MKYTEEVLKHFRNPKNVGEMKDADGVGKVGNVKCGDEMIVYIKVKDNKIVDAKFQTYGCVAALAASDVVCELAKGKTLDEAMKLDRKDITDYLGGLPVIKLHCSVLGIDALKAAIKDFKKKIK